MVEVEKEEPDEDEAPKSGPLTITMNPNQLEVILRRYFNIMPNDIVKFEIVGWKAPVVIESIPTASATPNFIYQEGARKQ